MHEKSDLHTNGNILLDVVMREDGAAARIIADNARRMNVASGDVLQQAGRDIAYSYFPLSGAYSLGCRLDDETTVNVQTLGYDSAVNASLGADLGAATHDVVCGVRGQILRIDAGLWKRLIHTNDAARSVAAVFTDYMLHSAQRMIACEMRHDVESRVCRALIDLHRWQKGGPLEITHQGLSELLGVRRTTISLIAHALQQAGIIAYKRGLIEVRDLHALKQASCSCHRLSHPWHEAAHFSPPRSVQLLDGASTRQ